MNDWVWSLVVIPNPVTPGSTRHPAFLALRARSDKRPRSLCPIRPVHDLLRPWTAALPSRTHVQNSRAAVASLLPDCRVGGAGRWPWSWPKCRVTGAWVSRRGRV